MRTFVSQSIKLRLPLLIVVLLGTMVAGLGWSAYRQLARAYDHAAGQRLRVASARLTEMMEQSIVRVLSEVRKSADDPALARVLARPHAANEHAARRALAEPTAPPQPVTRTLWSRRCELVLRVGPPLAGTNRSACAAIMTLRAPTMAAANAGAWMQPLVADGDSVRYNIIAPVLDAKKDTLGLLVETRTLVLGETGKILGELIGEDVVVMLGNAGAPILWTDLTRPVHGPAGAGIHDRLIGYTDATNAEQIGVARRIPSAPWAMWVQLRHAAVVAPAAATMRELGVIALCCLLVGVAAAWAIGRHVTTPLIAMTAAADAVARGDYTRRVASTRRDELGQLAASFNHMATQVERSSQQLRAQTLEVERQAEEAQDLAHELEVSNQELMEAFEQATVARRDVTVAESLLDEVLMQAPMGVAVFDREMRYVRLNQAIADINGVPLRDHIGKRPGQVVPGLGDLAEAHLQRVLRTGEKVLDQRAQGTMHGGAKRHFVYTCFPIRGAGDEVAGVGAIVLETTAQQELEQQLLQAQKMEAVGRLAGGVAHDFNNLLTVITSYSTMALGSLRPEDPLHQDICEVKGAAERATRLTKQLLAFSRKQVLRPQLLDLSQTAAEMERMLQRLIGEDVALDLHLASDLGLISADPGQIEQVLMNLVVNARDAMPEGGRVTIETANVTFSSALPMTEMGRPAGEYAMLTVTDTGTGMSEETLGNLFEPFFTTKPAGLGTGLGLSTVYGIVKQSGGDIHVRSEPGRGTTFRLYFPRVTHDWRAATRRTPAGGLPLGGSETILLVEDDESLRQLAARVLREAGYVVLDARTPAEAVRTGTHYAESIELLLTDVVMPQMSGRTISELLIKQRPNLAVLYMSGYTDDDILRRGVLATDTGFLPKPFTPQQLLQQVRAALNGRSSTRVA
jgi:signal transduction histidine kinase/ActR/RegA family two-component response regulator